jgi:hypothetical protein
MARKTHKVLRPQFFVIIIERGGVEISRDTLSARDASEARTIFLNLTSTEFFDPLDENLRCFVEEADK